KNQFNIQRFAIEEIRTAEPQHLTHQHIKGYFINVQLMDIPHILCSEENQWIEPRFIKRLAFPGFINQNIQHKKMRPALF
ncbi:MAG TPA: hypothetical protein VN958_04195, partial [Chitinophagaceae bacterium]|nr:hypothetical protein [Chitinophagaceae bacterium]